jgi:outer membrane protein TolC
MWRSTLLILALLLATATLQAEPVRVSTAQPDLAKQPLLPIEDDRVKLTLQDAISIALERNLSLVVERYFTEEAELVILQNRGIFDVFGTSDVEHLQDTDPTASNLAGAEVQEFEQTDVNFGVDQLFSTGGTLFADCTNRRTETNSFFATLNPSYRVDMDLTFSQPLLKNMGKLATERNIRIARTNKDISLENFELQVTSLILQIEEAYWNLAESIAQLAVAQESLDLAEQLHEQNQIRVEVGTLAPLELVQSEAGIAQRQLDIIRAKAAVGDRGDVLRQLLNIERDNTLWSMPIDPTTDPFSDFFDVDIDKAVSTALAARPEIRRKLLSLSNQELDVRYFANQRKPRLDLTGTYGLNGVGGDITERDFLSGEILATGEGDYGDAIDQILNADFDGWRVALNFAYPIQNRTAKAQKAIADVNYERGQAELNDLELAITTEVRRVARLLEASAEAVDSAEVNRRLQEENYEAEKKRYDNGMSTSFQVLRIQGDLSESRREYVAMVAAYRRALALHYQSLGTLIQQSGVEVVEGEEDRSVSG